MATTPTKPRDLNIGDVVRLPRMTADLSIETFDDTVQNVELVTPGRYRLTFTNDGSRVVSARETIDVVNTAEEDTSLTPNPMVEHYAHRLLSTQDVQRGSLRGDGPPTPLQVAAVLHGMADHTAIQHLLNVIANGHAMRRDTDDNLWPEATSVGRYFHALGDTIESEESEKRRTAHDPSTTGTPTAELLTEARALLGSDTRISADRRQEFRDLLDTLSGRLP